MHAAARDALAQLELLANRNGELTPGKAQAPAATRPPATRPEFGRLLGLKTRQPATPAAPPPATGMALHRARMRAKLLKGGADTLADHELLEMALFVAIPRCDTKPIAYRLLDRFGSLANAVSAPASQIAEVEGMGEASAAVLKIIQAAAHRLARAEAIRLPVLGNWDTLMDYLNGIMAREPIEQFRILFLDAKNRLIADEAQSRGTINHTPVYPREVVRRALELQAAAIILCHNHPSGDPTPSRDDIGMTQQIVAAAKVLSIAVHDHVIIGNGTWLSFRREGLL